ncbi:glycoside hydrolase family 97 protein [Pelagicoccus sp. SDUM812003]|uniref:glycoside hydrolase family 97 protein n=1 Tax=Pelagicoccus sp. SDUM812003 TaxID=3041267 RepID=UPI0028105352|nr:glycoside hydrolase family 97 protein [Pelagicoccus sp. SDUM812003]MDQ8204080.1 glycoside hydrolase family 97 protein [Pelagicoccus sp. SDUM812003]
MKSTLLALLGLSSTALALDHSSPFEASSPDGQLRLQVEVADEIRWSLKHDRQTIIAPSSIAMRLGGGEVLGQAPKLASALRDEVDTRFETLNYTRAVVPDRYQMLTLQFEGDFALEFRVYDEAVAYRFVTDRDGEIVVKDEEARFNFTSDHPAFIPYMWDYRGGEIFNSSFEALYDETPLSEWKEGSYAMTPMLVDVGQGKKAVILEADLEDYPGMYLDLNDTGMGLSGVFARYPLETKKGGYEEMNVIPTKRADYIAKTSGSRSFPWRVVVVSEQDKELLDIDIVQKLASPSRIEDTSWIRTGLVSWDWWNDYNLWGVDFVSGQNTRTYKHYIDFAAENNAPYIIIDWGWTDKNDLTDYSPEVDLPELIDYGKQRGVGVIVWASWFAVTESMETVFPLYEKMGVAGLKIDFIDRDDQVAVASTYEIAAKAAEHRLLVDYHGVFAPTGLQRTYPNVVGYEGVKGLENVKWADEDAPRYAVSIPFIRMMAGPMDYTPGAMTNVTQDKFAPINNAPMSKGTRVHQLAMYIMYESPLQMYSDSPSAYRQEQKCTDFIASIPTHFDDTVALAGEVGEYAALARRRGDAWFVAAMTNWEPRDLSLPLDFLEPGDYRMVVFRDGLNANRVASDYVKETLTVQAGEVVKASLAGGGGWAARIEPLP